MGSESTGGRDYSLTEIFAIKFVLADVLIIAALLFAGPMYALAFTALMVVSVVLVWYLSTRDRDDERDATRTESETDADHAERTARDPVTRLQERYADGELDDEEFEARLDRLLAADERAAEAGVETEQLSLERTE
ncbi:SHOCT domain-containing protein [Halosolutus gelatinilyticus]|uniref:SHOCT domain-containing protein n=1 Tax=Halosolutus gelatinilyticus TaxID=2931975 RepID=UPI001FF3F797|nr:SHOCT domain-containing protein [Halosolutus gelatinilyticus]